MQQITTPEGYVLPLNFKSGLPYLPICPYTDQEWNTLPHIIFTSDIDWDPSGADFHISDNTDWYDSTPDNRTGRTTDDLFDQFGTPRGITHVHTNCFRAAFHDLLQSNAMFTMPAPRTFEKFCASSNVIKRTFAATTQYARSGWIMGRIYNTHRSPFPALNVCCHNELVATDTFFLDTAAVNNGAICAQFFVGTSTKYVKVHGMKTNSHFVQTLCNSICTYGTMDTLVSDCLRHYGYTRQRLCSGGNFKEGPRYPSTPLYQGSTI